MVTSKEEIQRFNRWSDHRRGHVILYVLCFVLSCSAALIFYMVEQQTHEQCFIDADFTSSKKRDDKIGPNGWNPVVFFASPTGCRYVYAAFMLSASVSFIFGWFTAAFGASVETFLQGKSSVQSLLPASLFFALPTSVLVLAACALIQKSLVAWCQWMEETGKVHSCFSEPWIITVAEDTWRVSAHRIMAVQICSWLTLFSWLCQVPLIVMGLVKFRPRR